MSRYEMFRKRIEEETESHKEKTEMVRNWDEIKHEIPEEPEEPDIIWPRQKGSS